MPLEYPTPLKQIISGSARPTDPDLGAVGSFDLKPFLVDPKSKVFVIVDHVRQFFDQFSSYSQEVAGELA